MAALHALPALQVALRFQMKLSPPHIGIGNSFYLIEGVPNVPLVF
jgi:hypothetical protein